MFCSRAAGHTSKAHTVQPFSADNRAHMSSNSGRMLPMSGMTTSPRSGWVPSGRASSASVPLARLIRKPGARQPVNVGRVDAAGASVVELDGATASVTTSSTSA